MRLVSNKMRQNPQVSDKNSSSSSRRSNYYYYYYYYYYYWWDVKPYTINQSTTTKIITVKHYFIAKS